jgi:hypothetical protein
VDADEKQRLVRRLARRNRTDRLGRHILWSRHGVTELANEGWSRRDVENGLEACTLIEDYPAAHRALPDCLVLGWLRGNDPFHAVVAVDERNDSLFMVTVYKPSPEEWEDDWKTRKP